MLKARVDKNQGDIVKEFIKQNCSVTVTSGMHRGFPDLTVGVKGLSVVGDITDEVRDFLRERGLVTIENVTIPVEVKDGESPKSNQKLTAPQKIWHENWKGSKVVINSEEGVRQLLAIKDD